MSLEILYEDNHLIAVFKPAGLPTQADRAGQVCLLESVREHLRTTYSKPGNVFVGLLHRLDRPVSGVVLFAKTSKGASRLSEQFRSKTVRKQYWALVEGEPRPPSGTLVHYLGADASSGRVEISEVETPDSKRAELDYRQVRAGTPALVEVELKTGRKHQIRAQLASLGCPILGDTRYGARPAKRPDIALVAKSLEFDQPVTADRVRVEVPLARLREWECS